MAVDPARIGQRIRALRLERAIRQVDLARTLGISPAYLNLIEKGRRPVQLPLVIRAVEALGAEIDEFMTALGGGRPDDVLAALLDDPLARTLELGHADLAQAEPKLATTIAALFNLYKNARAQLDKAVSRLAEDEKQPPDLHGYAPGDEVTDFLEAHRNYFPELEAEAERFRKDARLPRRFVSDQLAAALKARHGLAVTMVAPNESSSVVRELEPKRRRLRLSSGLSENALKFQLGHALGLVLLDDNPLHERLVRAAAPRHAETTRLIKIHLANYFAGAVMLPYDDFHAEVRRTRYDVDKIAAAFEASYEAVAHRMCNLGDPRRLGVPLHFLRVDVAGNISKRYSASGLRFPRGHGSCPKWAVHAAFLTPAIVTKQYSRMPDGSTYFCFAKVIADPMAGSLVRGTIYSIGLGTPAAHAHELVYADDLPAPAGARGTVATGIACRFCERTDCNQRAAPSYKFPFAVDEYVKKDNFFSPPSRGDRISAARPRSKK